MSATAYSKNTLSEHHQHEDPKTLFGFWVYIMSDCILFACLFATYVVLENNTFGGPSSHDLFSMPFVLVETLALLTSSFTCGLAMLSLHKHNKAQTLLWLGITFLLGLTFVCMELYEFHELVVEGHSWSDSAFLSSFFTLVATHGLHVSLGLIWMLVMVAQISTKGINGGTMTKMGCLSLFWHFLDIIWICVFTVVYLLGVL